MEFLAKRLPRSEATRGTMAEKKRLARFYASASGAVHIYEKRSVFTRGFPRVSRGTFLFSQVEKRVFLENGALGSLGWAKNAVQE